MDDNLLKTQVKTEQKFKAKVEVLFLEAKQFVYKNSMRFKLRKFEAIHFSQKCLFFNPEI